MARSRPPPSKRRKARASATRTRGKDLARRERQQEERGREQDKRQRQQDVRSREQRNRERRQDRREGKLDERDRLHELFVAVLGHDLRSPITTVGMSAASLLRDIGNAEKAKATIDRIRRSADRMAVMVSELLDFTRIRLGSGFEIEKQRSDLVASVQEILGDFAVNHPEREVIRDFPTSVEADFDRDRLRQLLLNLLSNAAAYSLPGTPIVTRIVPGSNVVSITVENVGPPIPEEARDTLFDPFVRARKSVKSGSLGLGLYIAQEIAKAHGGEVTVTSDEGATAFTVRLPRSL